MSFTTPAQVKAGKAFTGTVDAVDNPDANEIARAVADNFAAAPCPKGNVPDYGINGDPVERY